MKFFKKKHLIIPNKCNKNFIRQGVQGRFRIFFKEFGILKIFQYKALVFFLKKRLKFVSKIFIRISRSLKNTKKAIGLRMGKGKGSINEYYLPIYRGQLLCEFYFRRRKSSLWRLRFLKIIRKLIILLSLKLHINIGVIR